MIQYIKDSIRELKHVVWPTREETRNYFLIVVSVLVIFGIYLFIASTVFTKSLFGLKDLVNSDKLKTNIETVNKKIDTKNISGEVKVTSKTDKKVEVNTEEQKTTLKISDDKKTEEKTAK